MCPVCVPSNKDTLVWRSSIHIDFDTFFRPNRIRDYISKHKRMVVSAKLAVVFELLLEVFEPQLAVFVLADLELHDSCPFCILSNWDSPSKHKSNSIRFDSLYRHYRTQYRNIEMGKYREFVSHHKSMINRHFELKCISRIRFTKHFDCFYFSIHKLTYTELLPSVVCTTKTATPTITIKLHNPIFFQINFPL